MDTAIINSRKQRFHKVIDKSINRLRLGKNGKISSLDKQKIKNTVAATCVNFLEKELKRPTTKTYDWYFTLMEKKVVAINHQRNLLGKNRYFIIDQEGDETLINNKFSYASTTGSQRVRELKIYNPEISRIISGSKALFAGMMKITVSEKEDAKIHAVYDTVDEKLIVQMTLALPLLIIGAVEALPVLLAYSEGAALPALGKAFTVNSGRVAAVNGLSNFGEQYVSIGMGSNVWGLENFKRMDVFDIGASAAFSSWGSAALKSEFDWSYSKGFEINNFNGFSENMIYNGLKFKGANAFGSSIGKPLANIAGNTGSIYNQGGQFIIRTVISTAQQKNSNANSKEVSQKNKFKD